MSRHSKSSNMFSVTGSGRHRVSPGRVRVVDLGVGGPVMPSQGARYVGRVGALALALGVGAAVVAVPLAAADTSGSAESIPHRRSSGLPKSKVST